MVGRPSDHALDEHKFIQITFFYRPPAPEATSERFRIYCQWEKVEAAPAEVAELLWYPVEIPELRKPGETAFLHSRAEG
jgi:hypothetical protein